MARLARLRDYLEPDVPCHEFNGNNVAEAVSDESVAS